ncbi:MAG TPA: ABC transporter substrate-binding protein, partial [Chloroflexota bacterium]|nr:ABC transporter substrate-binding protein [Chloroflexota bacterium]
MRLVALALIAFCLVGSSAPAAAQQTTSKTVTLAVAHEPDRFYNPMTVAGMLAANFVYDPLVGLDDQMRPYPVLAADIPSLDNNLLQLSGDGGDRRLIVTMPLRQDVTWSDGEPFTADDVVYMWQLMMNPQSGFDTSVEDKLKVVDKVDDFTVRFTYLSANEAHALDPDRYRDIGQHPIVDPLYFFGLYDAPAIYPRHVMRALVGDDPRHNAQVATI